MGQEFLEPLMPNHPVFDFPKGEDADRFLERHGVDGWNAMMAARNRRIELELKNPYEWRVEMPIWHVADFVIGLITWEQFASNKKPNGDEWELPIPQEWICAALRKEFENAPADILYLSGGNRSTKTTYVLDRSFRSLKKHPRSRMWAFHTTAKMSQEYHQLPMHDLMPPSDQNCGKTKIAYVSFKEATGFSDGKFKLRNGSSCEFHSYQEDLAFAEGGELGALSRERAIGYFADENCPLGLLEKLKARNSTRNAIGIHPYTAVDGYTPLVKWFREDARTIIEGYAKHLKKPRMLPIVEVKEVKLEGSDPFKIATIFFWSEWNPYGNFPSLLRAHSMDVERVKLIKFYGVAEVESNAVFPRLREDVHGFELAELPKEGTRYMVVDPTGHGRNWCGLWAIVDVEGRIWVYREWPCPKIPIQGVGYPGPWAEPGEEKGNKFAGKMGDGQRGFGFGILDYKFEFARLEGWHDFDAAGRLIGEWKEDSGVSEEIYLRIMDSRFGNTPHARADGCNTTLIEECAKAYLFFTPADGGSVSEGISLINTKLSFREFEDGSIEKKPMLMICRDCANLWYAMRNFTGLGGPKEATKDFIDLLRYLVKHNPQYVDPKLCNTGPYGGRLRRRFSKNPSMKDYFRNN